MADGGWQMADGGCEMADGGWQMADGGWQMADGRWQMAESHKRVGRWGHQRSRLLPSAQPPTRAARQRPSPNEIPKLRAVSTRFPSGSTYFGRDTASRIGTDRK